MCRVLTKCGPLKKGIANHFSILALKTPWTVWKGKTIGHWKMMLWKCCAQYASTFGKLSSGHRTGKGVFIPIPKKIDAKECSNYCTIALISHASKVMLKILQARLQQYVNCEPPDVQAGFRKGRGTRDQLPTSVESSKKQESSRKTSTSALLTMPKPLTVWIKINCGKFWKKWEYQTRPPDLPL